VRNINDKNLIEMRIPKRFKLFGTTIKVIIDNNIDDSNTIGISEFTKAQIRIAEKDSEDIFTKDTIIDTFYHERTHSILDAMGEHKLSCNEKFVEVFSRLLKQADATAEY
jgi:hypothetical protein